MKSVLITGGSGWFGQGMVKHLLDRNLCERICIFSRGEFNQAVMRKKFKDDKRLRWFIGDIRDKSRLAWACQGIDLVIAAAALKRIEVGFENPEEMVRTNILGAMNTIEAARNAGVQKVIFLSSDKAYQPISPYGQSKALAESLMLASNNTRGATGPIFASTRYGNVLGSTGSVIPTWRSLMAQGERVVPVTDPGCTRFAMTLPQAVELVVKTARTMAGGELIIPDLPAMSMGNLAKAMGVDMDIRGLPAWEKKHESMGPGNSSDKARRLTVPEIKALLQEIE